MHYTIRLSALLWMVSMLKDHIFVTSVNIYIGPFDGPSEARAVFYDQLITLMTRLTRLTLCPLRSEYQYLLCFVYTTKLMKLTECHLSVYHWVS